METFELKSHTTITSGGEAKSGHSIQEHDNAQLQRMGKKPVLKVGMTFGHSLGPRKSWRKWLTNAAKLRPSFNLWLQLYDSRYMGRPAWVSSDESRTSKNTES